MKSLLPKPNEVIAQALALLAVGAVIALIFKEVPAVRAWIAGNGAGNVAQPWSQL